MAFLRADVSRRDAEGAAEAPPPDENVHVHHQDPPHGLSPILPGSGAPWCLLRRHQEQKEEGGVPLHRRHLVLRGDGNGSGVRLLQVPVVTAPQFVTFVLCCNTHRCHFVNSTRQRGRRSEIFPRWRAPPLCDYFFLFLFFFTHSVWPPPICCQEKPQNKNGTCVRVFWQRENIL